jgi:hypothetical protein
MKYVLELSGNGDVFRLAYRGRQEHLGLVLNLLSNPGLKIEFLDEEQRPDITLAAIDSLPETVPEGTWLALNMSDDKAIQDAVYTLGAVAVLGPEVERKVFLAAIHNVVRAGTDHKAAGTSPRLFRSPRGTPIRLEDDRVLYIKKGIVRCGSIHPDGSETLIGFFGEGDVLISHQTGHCHMEMIAHTTTLSEIIPWRQAIHREGFHKRLEHRLCWMEAWAAIQARGALDERMVGILGLLAERFSKPHEGGRLLTLKITHEQLAGALGANRTTITRLLGTLRKEGRLGSVKTNDGEFLLLRPNFASNLARSG